METGTRPRAELSGSPPVAGSERPEGGADVADAGPKLLRGLLEVFILESLEQSPKHGYALLKEMTETFGQEPNRNRLYPLLARLVRDGYVREVSESGGNRTLYALTDAGTDALRAYRRLPSAFRHALRRIWSVEVHPHGAAAPARADAAPDAAPDEGDDAGPAWGDEEDADAREDAASATAVTMPAPQGAAPPRAAAVEVSRAPAAASGAHPYPCADARVTMEKDPSTGDLSIRLTGCPMGAYPYCPQCPVHVAVRGVRRLVFPE